MSGMFQMIEGETAILSVGGVYKEAKLATRLNGELFASYGGGFIRLYADGSTSAGSKVRLDTLALETPLFKDAFGKLAVKPSEGRKALDTTPAYVAIAKE